MVRDLGITNTQIGELSAAALITWAFSGLATSVLADHLGGRKRWIATALVGFGAFSFISGLAPSFGVLLLARLLMGLAEGPIVPLSLSVVLDESSPPRRGFNMGVVQSFGSQLVGSSLSPLILVWIATLFTWRDAFFIAGAPGILVATLIGLLVREPPHRVQPSGDAGLGRRVGVQLRELAARRNIRLCALSGCFLNAWYFGLLTFLPLYLTRDQHLLPRQMSFIMASGGVGAVLSAAIVPWLSDRRGRRPIAAAFSLLATVGPLGALLLKGNVVALSVAVFVGAWTQGVLPLCIGTIPMESTPRGDATAAGLMMAIGMIVGGIIGPAAFGRLADAYGLSLPLWGCVGAAVAAAAVCSRLDETAPALRVSAGKRMSMAAEQFGRSKP